MGELSRLKQVHLFDKSLEADENAGMVLLKTGHPLTPESSILRIRTNYARNFETHTINTAKLPRNLWNASQTGVGSGDGGLRFGVQICKKMTETKNIYLYEYIYTKRLGVYTNLLEWGCVMHRSGDAWCKFGTEATAAFVLGAAGLASRTAAIYIYIYK